MSALVPGSQIHEKLSSVSLCDDFPYLLTRITPAFYHVIPLSDTLEESTLRSLARYQHQRNQLPTCLVLHRELCTFFTSHGSEILSDQIPRGGIIIANRLKPCAFLENTSWWQEKAARLEDFVQRQRVYGEYLLGDLTKGSREASEDEKQLLSGATIGGIPKGLSKCNVCLEWKGDCLDPSSMFRDRIMSVSCRCENTNACARCLQPLADRKLNGNYWEDVTNRIIHVPGFASLGHICPTRKGYECDLQRGN
jgi:hypothetical protein